MRRSLVLLLLAALIGGCAGSKHTVDTSSTSGTVIRAMEHAYAERNLDAMMRLFAPDIQWMAVEGDKISLVADNPRALRTMMAENLASYPDAVWEITSLKEMGPFVATTEYAAWDDGAAELRNMVVYEVRQGLVQRIWYYPSIDG